MCIDCGNDMKLLWCRFGCGCFGHVSEFAANDHVCGYGGAAVCPHCQDLVTTMDEVRSGGHIWQQDAMNHPLFGTEEVSIVGDKSTFCQLYRESGNSLCAFQWKVERSAIDGTSMPGQDPCTLNQSEVDELVEFMDAAQLEQWRKSLLISQSDSSASDIPKKKKHAPSQKARRIKAKRAAAMHAELE